MGYAGKLHGHLKRGGLEVAETSYEAGQHVSPHWHGRPMVVAVLAGSMIEHVGGRSVQCFTGSAFFHPSGESHAHDFEADGSRCLTIQMDAWWLERLGVDERWLTGGPVELRDGRTAGAARLLRSELHLGPDALTATLDGLALRLLTSLTRPEHAGQERTPRFLDVVLERLHDDCTCDIDLTSLATLAGVSPEHLARTFRREQGLTVGQYVRRLRVEQARREIEAGHRSLGRLALQLGFYDQAHFTRVFKAHVGCTPGQYRRSSSPESRDRRRG